MIWICTMFVNIRFQKFCLLIRDKHKWYWLETLSLLEIKISQHYNHIKWDCVYCMIHRQNISHLTEIISLNIEFCIDKRIWKVILKLIFIFPGCCVHEFIPEGQTLKVKCTLISFWGKKSEGSNRKQKVLLFCTSTSLFPVNHSHCDNSGAYTTFSQR